MRVHMRGAARSAAPWYAALTALWFVACGVLGLRHQAQVDHVRDARTGAVHHAPRMIGAHCADEPTPDVHGRADVDGEDAPCELGSAHHAGGPLAVWRPIAVVSHPSFTEVAAPTRRAGRPGRVFRIAPKTSPPAA